MMEIWNKLVSFLHVNNGKMNRYTLILGHTKISSKLYFFLFYIILLSFIQFFSSSNPIYLGLNQCALNTHTYISYHILVLFILIITVECIRLIFIKVIFH